MKMIRMLLARARAAEVGRLSWPRGYALAIVTSVCAVTFVVVLARLQGAHGHASGFPLLILPVLVSAYLGGAGPGLLATAIVLLAAWVAVEPLDSGGDLPAAIARARWVALGTAGLAVVYVCERLKRVARRADAAQALDEATLASLVEGVVVADANRCIRSINASGERLLGCAERDALGRSLDAVVRLSPPLVSAPSSDDRDAMGAPDHESERILRSLDGREVPVTVRVSPFRDAHGQPDGLVVVLRDDTGDRAATRAEAEARALETKLADVAASAPGALFSFRLDADGTQSCPYATPSIRAIFGVGPEELVGDASRIFAVIAPEDVPRVAAAIGESARTLEPFHEDFRVIHPVKGQIWVTASSMPHRDPGGGVLWHGIVYDVSDRVLATRALAASELRFRSYVENAPDAVCLLDRDGRLLDFNATAIRMLGGSPDTMRGVCVLDLVTETHRAGGQADLERLARGETVDTQLPLETFDARALWVAVRAAPLGDGSILAYVRDVTAYRRADDSARESAARLAGIIESAMDGIVSIDEEQRIVLVNPAAEAMFGYRERELIGHSLDVLVPEVARAAHPELVRAFAASGTTRRRMGAVGEVNGRRADGETFPIETSISQVAIGGRKLLTAVVRDISGRRRAQAALLASDERFRQLAESIREVFWLTDVESQAVIYVSPAYETVWGRSVEDLYSSPQSWIDAIHSEDRGRVVDALAKQYVGTYDEEYRVVLPDGSIRWIRDQAFPVRDPEGRVIRIAGVAEDVTARRQLEEQLRQAQKLESVGLLAGGIAHDFNNLLTVIAGNTEMLLGDLPPEGTARELALEIERAGERAASLTRQLLAFSRRQVLEPKVLDLNAIVTDTEKMLRRLLGEDIFLEENLSTNVERVHLDPGHLVQVILNLAVNARDAMPKGGRLTIATAAVELGEEHAARHPRTVPGHYVMLSISDTGCGMPPEVLARIFEPFFTTKGPGRGTGMGLAVVHGIVEQSGGHLEVESQPNLGTTFRMYFPAVEAPLAARHEAELVEGVRGSETVLLVEDEESVRRLGERVLRSFGYAVITAADAGQALERAAAHARPIDLLVTDVVMPGRGGRELADLLRSSRPGIRVLFTSGYTDDAVVRHGIRQSDVWFLQKPFTPLSLAKKIREVLDQR